MLNYAPGERAVWLSASFGPPLVLLLSVLVSSDGFVSSDKYLLVAILLGVIPGLSALMLACPRVAQGANAALAADFLPFNLLMTLGGSLWIGTVYLFPKLPPFHAGLLAIVYATGAAALVARAVLWRREPNARAVHALVVILLAAVPVLLLAATVFPANWYVTKPFNARAAWCGAALACALLVLWRMSWAWSQRGKLLTYLAWGVMLVAPVLMMDVELDYDTLHYTAYLGPSAAAAAGKIPLIDVFAQYGQAYLIYNLGFLWLPWTYQSAALVTSLVNVVYTLCMLLILRRTVRHPLVFVVLAATLPFLFWLVYHYSPNTTPSQGGMRYLPVALLGAVLLWLPRGRIFSAFSVAAVFLCWAWSFEAALYGSLVYIGFAVATAASDPANASRKLAAQGSALLRLFALLVLFCVAICAIYLALFRQLPRYDLYVSMVLAYVGPDPFMDYSFYMDGFLGWVPLLGALFVVACLAARQCFVPEVTPHPALPKFVVLGALAGAFGVYCLISTQPFIMKVSLLPVLVLLYAAMEQAIAARPKGQALGLSEIGLAPVFVLMAFLFSGTAVGQFAGPPVYATANTSMLRHILSQGRIARADFAEHLHAVCNPPGVIEQGNLCGTDSPMPATHYEEFAALVAKWQATDKGLLMFHPMDAVFNGSLGRPHALPVSFSYTDGFSPALFQDILRRAEPVIERDLQEGQTLLSMKDFASLNELQWALLKRIAVSWALEKIDETEHFTAFRLRKAAAGAQNLPLLLPDRPIKIRNGF